MDKTKHKKNGMFKKSLDHFFFFFVQKGEEKIGEVVRHDDDSNQQTKRQKKWVGGGESDSAFKDKHTMHLMETGAGLVT